METCAHVLRIRLPHKPEPLSLSTISCDSAWLARAHDTASAVCLDGRPPGNAMVATVARNVCFPAATHHSPTVIHGCWPSEGHAPCTCSNQSDLSEPSWCLQRLHQVWLSWLCWGEPGCSLAHSWGGLKRGGHPFLPCQTQAPPHCVWQRIMPSECTFQLTGGSDSWLVFRAFLCSRTRDQSLKLSIERIKTYLFTSVELLANSCGDGAWTPIKGALME